MVLISPFCGLQPRRPVAVPGVRLADGAAALSAVRLRYPAAATPDKAGLRLADRCHSLRSLYPPLAALPSLPLYRILWLLSWRNKKVTPTANIENLNFSVL